MREIKFRVWDKSTKTLWSPSMTLTLVGGKAVTVEDNFILMQYTGLHDKNGKEIYHKDYVKMGPFRFIVEWDDKAAKFYLAAENELDTKKYTMAHAIKDGEVVGNIYENPELLSKENKYA